MQGGSYPLLNLLQQQIAPDYLWYVLCEYVSAPPPAQLVEELRALHGPHSVGDPQHKQLLESLRHVVHLDCQ